MDPVEVLPAELCQEIFLNLQINDIYSALNVSDLWNMAILSYEKLWKDLCHKHLSYCGDRMEKDRDSGYSWQEVYERNTTYQKTKGAWLEGTFSKVKSADNLPTMPMSTLGLTDWEEILDAELNR